MLLSRPVENNIIVVYDVVLAIVGVSDGPTRRFVAVIDVILECSQKIRLGHGEILVLRSHLFHDFRCSGEILHLDHGINAMDDVRPYKLNEENPHDGRDDDRDNDFNEGEPALPAARSGFPAILCFPLHVVQYLQCNQLMNPVFFAMVMVPAEVLIFISLVSSDRLGLPK